MSNQTTPQPTDAEIIDLLSRKVIPAGCAVIASIGWSDDEPSEFTATLRFPAGPPRIPMRVVFDGVPVRLVLVDGDS
jgi:hypothetical protein